MKSRGLIIFFLGLCGAISVASHAQESLINALPEARTLSPARVSLGKALFFDTRLSGDSETACSSCHKPEYGFSDGQALSQGYTGMASFRNSPSLINVAYKTVWFHDGRMGTNLNDVVREMITESWSMNMDMRLMQERLKQLPEYVEQFSRAGLGEPSNGGARVAIVAFLMSLRSTTSPYDQDALSAQATAGQSLFFGKAQCSSCHSGPLFTDQKAYRLGVPENPAIFSEVTRHMTLVSFAKYMGVSNPMGLKADPGAGILSPTFNNPMNGAFVTPSLRELVHSAPYMHNGMFSTLEQVVKFYSDTGFPNDDSERAPLNLSMSEQQALVAFLKSLSGPALNSSGGWPETSSEMDDYPVIEQWREVTN